MRPWIAAIVILVSGVTPTLALDYFGDISANRLVLKLTPVDKSAGGLLGLNGMQYLVLQNGVVALSTTSDPKSAPHILKGRLEIVNLVEVDPTTKTAKPNPVQMLRFIGDHGGWNKDVVEVTITIPYTLDDHDPRGMLQIATQGEVESRWRDPKNSDVDVVSYWSGAGEPAKIKVDVVESTLGFQNKLAK